MRSGLALACALLGGAAALPAGADAACEGQRWVGAWATAPDYRGPAIGRQTVRLVVTPHVGGRVLRLRLSNRFGSRPLVLGRVAVGRRSRGPRLVPGSNRAVAFAGRRSAVIGPGRDAVSDSVRLRFRPFQDLAVSIYVRSARTPATNHWLAYDRSYQSDAGDHTGETAGASFDQVISSWPFLTGINVIAPRGTGVVTAFGDSLTDGFPGRGSRNSRYPDYLARRLLRAGRAMSVLNAGLSSDGIVSELSRNPFTGLGRLGSDIPAGSGVTDVILLTGTNDIRAAKASARQVQVALRRAVRRLQRRGLRVMLGTLPPFEGADEPTRLSVNRWIRGSRVPDATVDFDRALRDADNPSRLDPRYDSGDGVHPTAAGYRRMAGAVDLRQLRGPSCRRR